MPHYSVVVAVKSRRLVASATRDFLHPVPAAAVAVTDGDEILWFCETGELRLAFERSPFQSGKREVVVPRGSSSPPETIVARDGRHRDVVRYAMRIDVEGEPPVEGVAHIIVEAGPAVGRLQQRVLDTREGEVLDRVMGGATMKHKLKLKKTGSKAEGDTYEKDGNPGEISAAFPYLIVKYGDHIDFEAPTDSALVVAFGKNGSPLKDGTMVLHVPKATKSGPKAIREPGEKGFFPHKYTVVLLKDLGTDIAIEDPQIIIDNEG